MKIGMAGSYAHIRKIYGLLNQTNFLSNHSNIIMIISLTAFLHYFIKLINSYRETYRQFINNLVFNRYLNYLVHIFLIYDL